MAKLLLTGSKGHGNLSIEPAALGLLARVLPGARSAVARASRQRFAATLLAAASILACLVALAVPRIGTPC